MEQKLPLVLPACSDVRGRISNESGLTRGERIHQNACVKVVPNISSWSIASTPSVSSSELVGSSIHKDCAISSDLRPRVFVGEKTTGLGLKTSAGILRFWWKGIKGCFAGPVPGRC